MNECNLNKMCRSNFCVTTIIRMICIIAALAALAIPQTVFAERIPIGCSSPAIDGTFCIRSTSEEGDLSRASTVVVRDGGAAGMVGPWLMWSWGDTFTTVPPASNNSTDISNTVSLSTWKLPGSGTDYRTHYEQLDSNGAPWQFVPATTYENNFNYCARRTTRPTWCETLSPKPPRVQCNASTGKCIDDPTMNCKNPNGTPNNAACVQRIVHWPGRPFEVASRNCTNRGSSTCEGDGIVFFHTFKTKTCLWCYDWMGTGISRATLKASQINTRGTRDPNYLFTPATGQVAFVPTIVHGGYLYLRSQSKIGRVLLANIGNASSYKYWTGTQWLAGQANATANTGLNGAGETFAYNPYVNKFLATYSSGNEIYMQASSTITGPWSAPVKIATARAGGTTNYYSELHPELDSADHSSTVLTYYHGNALFNGTIPTLRILFRILP